MFEFYCSAETDDIYGFSERGKAGLSREHEAKVAPVAFKRKSTIKFVVLQIGSFYWWNGEQQLWPNAEYQENALAYAQSAYFVSIVVVQWADLLIAKTRKLSIFTQVTVTSEQAASGLMLMFLRV